MVFGTLWVCQKDFDEQISWVLFRELTWTLCVELAHSGSCWAFWLPRLKKLEFRANRELSSWGTHIALAEALSLTPTTHVSCGDWLTTTYSFSSKVSDIFVFCMTSLGTHSNMPRLKPIYIIGNKISLKKNAGTHFASHEAGLLSFSIDHLLPALVSYMTPAIRCPKPQVTY